MHLRSGKAKLSKFRASRFDRKRVREGIVASVLTDLERRVEAHPEKLLFSFLDKNGVEVAQHSYASFSRVWI